MRDIAIIGGGAAGLAAAVMLIRRSPGISVTILERSDRVGRKLSSTGNGRCNITNANACASFYHGDAKLAGRLLENFGYDEQKDFFLKLGVPFVEEDAGKIYPMSLQASSVTDALRFEASELGVNITTCCEVSEITKKDNIFNIKAQNGTVKSRAVLIACGGIAGGKTGSSSGYALLKSFGHKIEKTFPAVVQIKTEPSLVRQLKGIKINGAVTVTSGVGARTEYGEILFCDYGISGPPVLQTARLVSGENPFAVLDLMPALSEDDIYAYLSDFTESHPLRPAPEVFTGFMNKRLGQVILKSCGGNMKVSAYELSEKVLKKTAHKIKAMRLEITGTTGFENAQVTAGGAQTTQFFDTLMSKKVKGLFAAGEVLDVDGDCGGFNLAFCWACANAAANGIIDYLKDMDK